MKSGLIVSDPAQDSVLRQALLTQLSAQEIPFSGFTPAPAPLFADLNAENRSAFLYRAAFALMQPGQPLPLRPLLHHLSGDAQPGNVLRKYVCLQLSLLPYFRVQREVCAVSGGVLLGESLLTLSLSDDGAADVLLPPGCWTELNGCRWTGHFRQMRGYNELPVLIRENTLLPIGVNDRDASGDDADRLTLHYFQPADAAECLLADGTRYRVWRDGTGFRCESTSQKSWHVIVHQGDEELFLR